MPVEEDRSPPDTSRTQQSLAASSWLRLAAFCSGASVMLVEVVGTRVLTPLFGVGLYVWSAQLVVTLGALAAGYYLGGFLVDRSSKLTFPLQLLLAGMWLALVPWLRTPLLLAFGTLGLRTGALLSAAVLFGPALLLLGMVSTSVLKIAAEGSAKLGQAVGGIYALATVGSLVGTLAAGFWLVPNYPVPTVLLGIALLLIVVGIVTLRADGYSSGVGIPALLVLGFGGLAEDYPSGPAKVLARQQSLFGNLAVVEDVSRAVPLKLLKADHSIIGGQWATGEPAFGFVYILEAGHYARPQAERALVIGLGIGSAANALMNAGLTVDVVELDPGVVELAKEHFGFKPNGEVYIEDARTLLNRLEQKYDLIIHDTFTGGSTPEHLLSLEVMQELSRVLSPNGILTLNMVGAPKGKLSRPANAVRRTLGEQFKYVRAYLDGPQQAQDKLHNVIFFAAKEPFQFPVGLASGISEPQRRRVLSNFQNWEVLRDHSKGPIITDDYNPLTYLSTPVSEEFQREIGKLYPPRFWLE